MCGQKDFARVVDEATDRGLRSAFIFDSAELVAILSNYQLSKSDFLSDEAAILSWISNRDTQLNCITKVPNLWGRMCYVIQVAIDDGVGEAFCPICQCIYPVSELVKPEATFNAGWNFNNVHCPENHLLHQTQGIHIHVG